MPKLLRAQRELGMPAWEDVPCCPRDPKDERKYCYDAAAWQAQATKSFHASPRKRLRGKAAGASPVQLPAARPAKRLRSKAGPSSSVQLPQATRQAAAPAASSAPSGLCLGRQGPHPMVGWWCSLLRRRLGVPVPAPPWFNDPRCGAVNASTGTQRGFTCGLFAVNHCLAKGDMPYITLAQFTRDACDGVYPEGDFDDSALRRNLDRRGCRFDRLEGAGHEEAVRQLNNEGLLAVFHGDRALGCIVHLPCPRHWVALVPPPRQESVHVAAVLCDSLHSQVFTLSVVEMHDLFGMMGSSHLTAGESQRPLLEQEQVAAGWSAYTVTR